MNGLLLARKLISIPSWNASGSTCGPGSPPPGERAMADFLEEWLHQNGAIQITRSHPLENRPNLTAFFDFHAPETIIFEAHLDTVPVAGMTVDPYAGTVENGRLYGRGACDVKGPMAAMLTAIAQQRLSGQSARRNILFAAVCDEESGFSGVRHFVRQLDRSDSEKPRFAVVAEPTDLRPVITHKGTARWIVSIRGVAAHSSTPQLGQNAIHAAAPVIEKLKQHADSLSRTDSHPLLGNPTLSIGIIRGGSAVNIVPDLCELEVDRRLIPGETPESALAQLEEALAGLDVEICVSHVSAPPMEIPSDHPAVRVCLAAAQTAGVESSPDYASYCTDASFYQETGIPAVVFGPGSIRQAHTKDEFITLDDLENGIRAYQALLTI